MAIIDRIAKVSERLRRGEGTKGGVLSNMSGRLRVKIPKDSARGPIRGKDAPGTNNPMTRQDHKFPSLTTGADSLYTCHDLSSSPAGGIEKTCIKLVTTHLIGNGLPKVLILGGTAPIGQGDSRCNLVGNLIEEPWGKQGKGSRGDPSSAGLIPGEMGTVNSDTGNSCRSQKTKSRAPCRAKTDNSRIDMDLLGPLVRSLLARNHRLGVQPI